MCVMIDIYITVRYTSVFYHIDASVDQKLCSKGYTVHSHGSSRLGNRTAGCVSLSMAEGTVAIPGQPESAQIGTLGII